MEQYDVWRWWKQLYLHKLYLGKRMFYYKHQQEVLFFLFCFLITFTLLGFANASLCNNYSNFWIGERTKFLMDDYTYFFFFLYFLFSSLLHSSLSSWNWRIIRYCTLYDYNGVQFTPNIYFVMFFRLNCNYTLIIKSVKKIVKE